MVIKPKYFFELEEAESWFEKNHLHFTELWIGFTKPKAKKQALGYKVILDVALCHGWIDAVRKSIDEEYWMIRFTPRKKSSIWSAVNLQRMKELIAEGRVKKNGLHVYENRDLKKANLYSFENQPKNLSPEFEAVFRKNKKAWKWFSESAPSYRKTAIFLVMSAKQEETRVRRLKRLIADCEAGRKLKELSYDKKK
ncbi:MAG TPA: YdeI/OmpD-associated family protein [Bacteroidia bacterium]|jgi:uncharacterized protein YdeI (YjbR/CyaY-like superfamily)|nr:YdeI/OmpD-associated family protein [Bacteroidia bacterium]